MMAKSKSECPGFPEPLILSLVTEFSISEIQKILILRRGEGVYYVSRECEELAGKEVCQSCNMWLEHLLTLKKELGEENSLGPISDSLDIGVEHSIFDQSPEKIRIPVKTKSLKEENESDLDITEGLDYLEDDWEPVKKRGPYKKHKKEDGSFDPPTEKKDHMKCDLCSEEFHSLPYWSAGKSLFRHEQDIHGLHLIICQFCGKQFKKKRELEHHVERDHLMPQSSR